jgi:hypothetical protein
VARLNRTVAAGLWRVCLGRHLDIDDIAFLASLRAIALDIDECG